jgi:hypothetical protein
LRQPREGKPRSLQEVAERLLREVVLLRRDARELRSHFEDVPAEEERPTPQPLRSYEKNEEYVMSELLAASYGVRGAEGDLRAIRAFLQYKS